MRDPTTVGDAGGALEDLRGVEALDKQLFGANRRPTGQRGVLMWFRTGSDSGNDNGFRVLNVATTA